MVEMHEERIHEPIGSLIARFEGAGIAPLSFRWRRREYTVRALNARWTDRSIQPSVHGFTVTVDSGDVFELSYQEGEGLWRLERIFLV
ncbi:MAG: DUF6504 family protein [Planctomycetota bacterium]|jgi:hypothetical protein